MPIERGTLRDGGAVEHVDHVPLDVLQFVRAEHALEHVETGALVGVEDLRVHAAVTVDDERATIAERHRPRLTGAAVLDHRRLGLAVVDDRDFHDWQLPHAASVSPARRPRLRLA